MLIALHTGALYPHNAHWSEVWWNLLTSRVISNQLLGRLWLDAKCHLTEVNLASAWRYFRNGLVVVPLAPGSPRLPELLILACFSPAPPSLPVCPTGAGWVVAHNSGGFLFFGQRPERRSHLLWSKTANLEGEEEEEEAKCCVAASNVIAAELRIECQLWGADDGLLSVPLLSGESMSIKMLTCCHSYLNQVAENPNWFILKET